MAGAKKLKRIEIAVVGSAKCGKTFIIDALTQMLNPETYSPLSSDIYNLDWTDNGINADNIEFLHPSYSENSTKIFSPESLSQFIISNIDNPQNIKTEIEKDRSVRELYSGVVRKGGEEKLLLTFFNVPGETFSQFLKPLSDGLTKINVSAIFIMSQLPSACRSFWNQELIDENESWLSFERYLQDNYPAEMSNANFRRYIDTTIKNKYLAFLYCCNATDIIYCKESKLVESDLEIQSVTLLNTFRDTKKNYYRVLTKFDLVLNEEINTLETEKDFEKYYSNLVSTVKKKNYSSNPSFRSGVDTTEICTRIFGNLFSNAANSDFLISCSLHLHEGSGKFVPIDKGKWTNNYNQGFANNEMRRSIGIRELISTIFYKNAVPLEELGNLIIREENLRGIYYL